MEDLIGGEEYDPKKLFDKTKYNTLIIGREGLSKSENEIADILESLFDKDLSREMREELFTRLKDINAADMLVSTIKETKDREQQALLTEAFWASGLEAKDHFLFFVELACTDHFQLAHEAITVLEYTETRPSPEILNAAMRMANASESSQHALLGELKAWLNHHLT